MQPQPKLLKTTAQGRGGQPRAIVSRSKGYGKGKSAYSFAVCLRALGHRSPNSTNARLAASWTWAERPIASLPPTTKLAALGHQFLAGDFHRLTACAEGVVGIRLGQGHTGPGRICEVQNGLDELA